MASITRVPTDRQDCLHAKAQFDAYFREALKGRGLSSDDKVIYAYLVSQTRIANGGPVAATIGTIAEDCEISYHHTWAALKALAEQALVKKTRRGLGLSNTYELVPIPGVLDAEDIVGKASPESAVRPVRGKKSGQSESPARAGTYGQKKKNEGRSQSTDSQSFDASAYYISSEGDIRTRT